VRVLVTGATGFVGRAVCARLLQLSFDVSASTRFPQKLPDGVKQGPVETIDVQTDWSGYLGAVDTVVHLAARVHVMNDRSEDALAEFRRCNVEGTMNLARQAVDAGVKRFVFISSIKVNGEETLPGQPFCVDDDPRPADPYGISKMEAEQELRTLAQETGLEVVIVRPPLVYGPGVKANFLSMIRWVARGVPLPLGAIHNQRSFVALGNLVDFLVTCVEHPHAANQTFLVSDGEDFSTTELLKRIAAAMGRPAHLIPVPVRLLKVGLGLLGKGAIASRLCGSLQVDMSRTRELLGWTPPLTVDEGLRSAVAAYKADR